MRFLLAVVVALLLPGSTIAQEEAARIVGRVFGPDGKQPVAGVSVRLGALTATTDARGAFLFAPAPIGQNVLEFQMIGYRTRADTIAVTSSRTTDVNVRLVEAAVALPPVTVTVRSRWLEDNGYYERKLTSGLSGRFIERAEIERRAPAFLTDLFRDVPGAKVHYFGAGVRVIQFSRQNMTEWGSSRDDEVVERWIKRLPGCQPLVYIDGRPHSDRMSGGRRMVTDFNMINPDVIEAIETYVGAAVPSEYRSDGCGVVLIWTRRG